MNDLFTPQQTGKRCHWFSSEDEAVLLTTIRAYMCRDGVRTPLDPGQGFRIHARNTGYEVHGVTCIASRRTVEKGMLPGRALKTNEEFDEIIEHYPAVKNDQPAFRTFVWRRPENSEHPWGTHSLKMGTCAADGALPNAPSCYEEVASMFEDKELAIYDCDSVLRRTSSVFPGFWHEPYKRWDEEATHIIWDVDRNRWVKVCHSYITWLPVPEEECVGNDRLADMMENNGPASCPGSGLKIYFGQAVPLEAVNEMIDELWDLDLDYPVFRDGVVTPYNLKKLRGANHLETLLQFDLKSRELFRGDCKYRTTVRLANERRKQEIERKRRHPLVAFCQDVLRGLRDGLN